MNRRSQIFRRDDARPGNTERQSLVRRLAARAFGTVFLLLGGASVLLGVITLILLGEWSSFQEGIAGMIALSITVPGLLMLLTGFLARRFAAMRKRQQPEDDT